MRSKLTSVSILLLFCIFCSSCRTRTDKSFINNWVSYPIKANLDSLHISNNSPNDWYIYLKNDSVRVIDFKNHKAPSLPFVIKADSNKKILRGDLSILKVNDGYLIGSYRGEWGGGLYWFSSNGDKSYMISGDEIVQFLKKGDEIYAIQGLAHLFMSEGSIISIEKIKNTWTAKQVLKLPTAPYAAALDSKQNFIVITSKSLFKIDENFSTTILIDSGIWYRALYPNSLIVKNDIIYAGMRACVYKYNLVSKKQEWLLPN